uniref:Serpentine Receptor, class H n=1 Tax=Caenorhabditis tropicalis TaxID=1561998 RepID=A0A1I7UKY0_9PELO
MQPLPLFPVISGYSIGYLAIYFDVWTHYLIAFIVSAIVAQLESLTFCFIKKHQTIAGITKKHIVPENLHNFLAFCLPFVPLIFFVSFCEAGMRREEQLDYVREHYPDYVSQFSSLPNFAIYSLNNWFLFVILMAFGGGVVCALVFSLSTIDMFRMLTEVQRKISILNFRRHQSCVKSLLAQFAASSLLLIPLFCFVIVIMLELSYAQDIIQITLAVFSLRSSVNAIVLVFTTPPYRNFVLRRRHGTGQSTKTVKPSSIVVP